MQAKRKQLILSLIAAPLLFGLGVLLLSLDDYEGVWYYVLYFLSHFLTAGFYFLALHFVYSACPDRKRAFLSALPLLGSLSVYHLAIAFYESYAVWYEEAFPSVVYALLALFTDAILAEWLLLLFTALAAYLFFLRGDLTQAKTRAAWLLSALIYFTYLLVGRVTEFVSFTSAHFGFADETTTTSFVAFLGTDLLIAAFGYLTLFLADRTEKKGGDGQ